MQVMLSVGVRLGGERSMALMAHCFWALGCPHLPRLPSPVIRRCCFGGEVGGRSRPLPLPPLDPHSSLRYFYHLGYTALRCYSPPLVVPLPLSLPAAQAHLSQAASHSSSPQRAALASVSPATFFHSIRTSSNAHTSSSPPPPPTSKPRSVDGRPWKLRPRPYFHTLSCVGHGPLTHSHTISISRCHSDAPAASCRVPRNAASVCSGSSFPCTPPPPSP